MSSLPGSPSRLVSSGNPMVPLSLISKPMNDDIASKVSINPIKLSTNLQMKPNMMPIATPSNGNQMMPAALNLKAGEVPSSCQTMPLNLHAISSVASIQPPLNGLKNGLKGYNRFVNCVSRSSSRFIELETLMKPTARTQKLTSRHHQSSCRQCRLA